MRHAARLCRGVLAAVVGGGLLVAPLTEAAAKTAHPTTSAVKTAPGKTRSQATAKARSGAAAHRQATAAAARPARPTHAKTRPAAGRPVTASRPHGRHMASAASARSKGRAVSTPARRPAGVRKLQMASSASHPLRRPPASRPGRHSPAVAADRPLIVIDPGHGGTDPGAIGAGGTREKDITLAIAQELKRSLDATGRYRTALTRSTDRTVSLGDRLAFARRHDADMLIAIHADASPDRHARGASVYVRRSRGGGLTANAQDPGGIAAALSAAEPHPAPGSAWLQYSMIEQLADDIKMVGAPARAAHLYVLGARDIPSVLLETGFISNRRDEALLKQPAHRRVLVRAIRDALDDYYRGLRTGASRT
ncbi:N-acetylmuramoyl-L-alanine amidase family protein [Rhodopila sp.]|jgi:N-acetylmuramoyl-L-alanine amidase|uniref:N-acetylmuramoyl-L-alanine amidase family protein n=1 Tax=Rhodopila sp. TaxID=2480087 RepID=UPI002B81833B|nr:N-acetylmuramoyl-L-alanine amidase [Rhodopila sp.]HVZ07445.1 N-acetylmuramoyl-L-alanine amidase [Rhodopila sp.]